MSALDAIERPTLLLDPERARANIARMAERLARVGVSFRPHCKTHQSPEVGSWLAEAGARGIAVSSVDMAARFAHAGWRDIAVAFPVNPRQARSIDALAAEVDLGLLVDCEEAVDALDRGLSHGAGAWIKVDVGHGRVGVPWDATEELVALARAVISSKALNLRGLMTHAGHSYMAEGPEGVLAVHAESTARILAARESLESAGFGGLAVSVGDTPFYSLAEDFEGIDEARPGNFALYDLTQARLGACSKADIAVAVACPVVGKRAGGKVALYGGAVHLSKESLEDGKGGRVYGYLARREGDRWGEVDLGAPVVELSQEHGIAMVKSDLIDDLAVGGLAIVIPVHACLTADLHREYLLPDGSGIPKARSLE